MINALLVPVHKTIVFFFVMYITIKHNLMCDGEFPYQYQVTVLWHKILCNGVVGYQHLRGTCCLHDYFDLIRGK